MRYEIHDYGLGGVMDPGFRPVMTVHHFCYPALPAKQQFKEGEFVNMEVEWHTKPGFQSFIPSFRR